MTLQQYREWRQQRLLKLFGALGDSQERRIREELDRNWGRLSVVERAILTVRFGLRPDVPARSCCNIAMQCRAPVGLIRRAVAETLAKMTPFIIDPAALQSPER